MFRYLSSTMARIFLLAAIGLYEIPVGETHAMQSATYLNSETKIDEEPTEVKDDAKLWNLPMPTLGGKQFWTDYRWWQGWRVQYNSTLDHWRLIDPKSVRRAWGGRQAMLDEFNRVIVENPSVPDPSEVVLLLHGLMRTASSMAKIEAELLRVDTDIQKLQPEVARKRTAIPFSYSSTRGPISAHSSAFRELVESLPGLPQISVVGHSMGNIVFRHALGEWNRNGDPKKVLPRINRVVMLGPPNQGSSFASQLSRLGLFETITGNAGMQLGPSWDSFRDGLGTPACPFAIVAGDISKGTFQNPWLSGPSDGVVTLEEATLDGSAEIVSVPVLHSFLMSDASVVRATVSFLSGTGLEAALDNKK